ncbi:MAG TPA: hypothetical protein PLT92_00275 [Ignavibacteriaceae bacterium]|nr:hypothetical protein [Ignavibacteriaceae bacterium]
MTKRFENLRLLAIYELKGKTEGFTSEEKKNFKLLLLEEYAFQLLHLELNAIEKKIIKDKIKEVKNNKYILSADGINRNILGERKIKTNTTKYKLKEYFNSKKINISKYTPKELADEYYKNQSENIKYETVLRYCKTLIKESKEGILKK